MKKSLSLVILAVATCSCNTTLVYTGSVKTGDNQKAVEFSKVLEEEYARQGLKSLKDWRAPTGACYSTSWRKHALFVGDWVKDGTLFVRIVPAPYSSDVSREFGEHMRAFMTDRFSELEWRLVAKYEFDVR